MNPLAESPRIRKIVYRIMWIIGVALGSIQTWYLTVSSEATPPWLKGAFAVYGFVSIATNFTADRNVTQNTPAQGAYVGRRRGAPES